VPKSDRTGRRIRLHRPGSRPQVKAAHVPAEGQRQGNLDQKSGGRLGLQKKCGGKNYFIFAENLGGIVLDERKNMGGGSKRGGGKENWSNRLMLVKKKVETVAN